MRTQPGGGTFTSRTQFLQQRYDRDPPATVLTNTWKILQRSYRESARGLNNQEPFHLLRNHSIYLAMEISRSLLPDVVHLPIGWVSPSCALEFATTT